jgi:CRISPR-associated endonuclease/helicase Cas3
MAGHRQALAVVHKRADARRLSGLLPEEGQFHLSTRMCAAHRLETLHAIKERLERRAICRVVSTQLVEAGVDISFPVVYRAMAGLDSLAQAAGRCNRHGELHGSKGELALGEFVIFRAESMPPGGVLRRGLEVTDAMLRIHGELDLTDPATLHEYFRGLYFRSNTDVHGVMPERRAFNFATVARKARLITNATRPVVVSWKDGRARIEEFEQSLKWRPGGSRRAARALQPFVVQVFDHELRLLERQGAIAVLDGLGHALVPQFLHLYDERFGLTLDESLDADVSSLIV